ncbi:MAG: MFS transporter [Candidatus Krumholzibacteriota bacterium]|nr:MFS transporter [Candidatus Krumholzibacteriota bacterium]
MARLGKELGHVDEPAPADEAPPPHERVEVRVVLFVVAIYVVSFLFQVAFYMVPVQLPFFLGELGVNDPSRVGAALSTMTLCAAIVAFQFRRIQSVLDRTVILAISLSMLGIGFLLVSRATSFPEVIAALVVIGCGAGLNFPNLMSWLMARTPQPVRGRIVGGLTTALFLGQFFSPIASHPFVESGGLSHGYRMMGIFMGVLALVAFVSSVLKPFQSRRSPGS